MYQSAGLVKRKNVSFEVPSDGNEADSTTDRQTGSDHHESEPELTLLEELFLLGLKDSEGIVSLWNDMLSVGLRGCILIELGFRGRLELEKPKLGRRSLLKRNVVVKNPAPTGQGLLDEALKVITATYPLDTVDNWISYLSGESWNLLKIKLQLKNVRNRVAKCLVEKGILKTEMKNYLIFDMTVYPLEDPLAKSKVIKKVIDTLLDKWSNDPQKMNKRLLALAVMANVSDVLENAFVTLSNEDYFLATKRIRELADLDLEEECAKGSNNEIIWAVFAYFR